MRGAQGCDGGVAALSLRSVLMRVVVSAVRVRRRRGILKYPRFCSYSVARAGVGWLAGCEVPVRAASYSAGGT